MNLSDQAMNRIAGDIEVVDCYIKMCNALAHSWARKSFNAAQSAEQLRADGLIEAAAVFDKTAEDANQRADGYLSQALLARVD